MKTDPTAEHRRMKRNMTSIKTVSQLRSIIMLYFHYLFRTNSTIQQMQCKQEIYKYKLEHRTQSYI